MFTNLPISRSLSPPPASKTSKNVPSSQPKSRTTSTTSPPVRPTSSSPNHPSSWLNPQLSPRSTRLVQPKVAHSPLAFTISQGTKCLLPTCQSWASPERFWTSSSCESAWKWHLKRRTASTAKPMLRISWSSSIKVRLSSQPLQCSLFQASRTLMLSRKSVTDRNGSAEPISTTPTSLKSSLEWDVCGWKVIVSDSQLYSSSCCSEAFNTCCKHHSDCYQQYQDKDRCDKSWDSCNSAVITNSDGSIVKDCLPFTEWVDNFKALKNVYAYNHESVVEEGQLYFWVIVFGCTLSLLVVAYFIFTLICGQRKEPTYRPCDEKLTKTESLPSV